MSMNEADSFRIHFPEDEERLPWLSLLLEAYAAVDAVLAQAVRQEEARRGVALACPAGCSHCCVGQSVLATPLEVEGMAWYATARVQGAERVALKRRLLRPAELGPLPCPFLIEGRCAVYPVRPFPCREFLVFGVPCAPEEDVVASRLEDVLRPPGEAVRAAQARMLPHYETQEDRAEQEGNLGRFFLSISSVVSACDWSGVYRSMAATDKLELRRGKG
jgi:uncharacterized protein